MQSEPGLFSTRQRISEILTNAQFIPRIGELEAQGAEFWVIKVLNHNAGYSIQCDLPVTHIP